MSRLSKIFKTNERCFIPFVTAGHPCLEMTAEIILELDRAGAHIIEIGIPFSDPIADGPIIQNSSMAALRHGHSIDDYLNLVRQIRRHTDVGLLFMSYLNPLLAFGLQRLSSEAARAGLDALLISDLTPEEFERVGLEGGEGDLDPILLVAPTSSRARIQQICSLARGFVYLVARTGVTGKQSSLGSEVETALSTIREYSSLPVAVGFGIRSRSDVARVWEQAEGAVVGSAIVDFIERRRDSPDLPVQVGNFVRTLIP